MLDYIENNNFGFAIFAAAATVALTIVVMWFLRRRDKLNVPEDRINVPKGLSWKKKVEYVVREVLLREGLINNEESMILEEMVACYYDKTNYTDKNLSTLALIVNKTLGNKTLWVNFSVKASCLPRNFIEMIEATIGDIEEAEANALRDIILTGEWS